MSALEHVCIFMTDLAGGGAERMMVNLANGFASRGLRTDLVAASAAGPYRGEIDAGVDVIDLARTSTARSVPAFAAYLRRARPQVVIVTLHHTSIAAMAAHAVARVDAKLFIREANTPSQRERRAGEAKARVNEALVRLAYRYASGVLAVSEGVADDLRGWGVPARRITTLRNPVVTPDLAARAAEGTDHPWFADGGPPVVLGAGRLHPQKDFPTLLRAFAKVRAGRTARLVILGEGGERAALLALARELGVDGDVDLPGFVSNPFALMARAEVFVLSSIREGLPGVLIQAMAVGCPVVATDCRSGPAEVLDGGRFGELVSVGDDDAMADAIARTLDRPPDRDALRTASGRFASERVVDAYVEFLERALGPSSRSGSAASTSHTPQESHE